MRLKEIREGPIRLLVPEESASFKGPGKKVPGFYNPTMALSRDISTAILKFFWEKGDVHKVLDALAGSGARGLRYKAEIPDLEVHLNDICSEACSLIEKNARLNSLEVKIFNEDFNCLASKEKYDYIDLDPFGSPVHFSDTCFRGLLKKGFLAITSTDTSTLFGTYPKSLYRRYFARGRRFWYSKEMGVRILIAYFCREGGKWDRAVWPIFCHATDHYARIFLKVEKGAKKADEILENFIGYLILNEGELSFSKDPYGDWVGPLWIGPLYDPELLQFLKSPGIKLADEKRYRRLMLTICEEGTGEFPYYDLHSLFSMKKTPGIPKISAVISKLREAGFFASRTHFSPTSIRTNAPLEKIVEVVSEIVSSKGCNPCRRRKSQNFSFWKLGENMVLRS